MDLVSIQIISVYSAIRLVQQNEYPYVEQQNYSSLFSIVAMLQKLTKLYYDSMCSNSG